MQKGQSKALCPQELVQIHGTKREDLVDERIDLFGLYGTGIDFKDGGA